MDIENIKKTILKEYDKIKKTSPSDIRLGLFRFSKRLPDIIHLRHIVFFSAIFSIVILILFGQRFNAFKNFEIIKPIVGGTYTEGIVGDVKRINPLFSPVNPAEEDLSNLIFSGLTKTGTNGKITGDLAENWTISADGLVYEFNLKKDIKWHDEVSLTADDVIFTISTIQNPDTRSPLFTTWKGAKAEKIDEDSFRITIDKPLRSFLSATNVKIIPKHLLEKVPAQNIKLTDYNEAPVGSGPFVLQKMEIKKNYTVVSLLKNKKYFASGSNLDKVKIRTYRNESELLDGYVKKEVQGVSRVTFDNLEKAKKIKGIRLYTKNLPEYTAIFLNQKNEFLRDKNLRNALTGALDRDELKKIFENNILPVSGPIPPGTVGKIKKSTFKPTKDEVNSFLDQAGWKLEGNVRKKDGKELEINFLTIDSPEFKITAEYVKKKWSEYGIKVNILAKSFVDLQQNNLRPRNYDALLITENVGTDGDILPYWHSSGKNDPGLNFSYFEDKKVDKYLEIARESTDNEKNREMLEKAQEIIVEEKPAIFLYSPLYIYGVSKDLRGIDIGKIKEATERFNGITDWYLVGH